MTQSVQTAPKLHDIPLTSSDDPGDTLADIDADVPKEPSRGSSLKRLFKLAQKRPGDARSDNGPTLLEVVNMANKDVGKDPAELPEKEKVRNVTRRFQLNLGSMQKEPELESMKSSTSKSTLKDSLSNYWNNMFKRSSKKNKNKSKSNETSTGDGLPDSTTTESSNVTDGDDDDDDEETNETELSAEDVHNLAISEGAADGSNDNDKEQQAEDEDEEISSEK